MTLRRRCACSSCAYFVNGPGYIGHQGSCWADLVLSMIRDSILADRKAITDNINNRPCDIREPKAPCE